MKVWKIVLVPLFTTILILSITACGNTNSQVAPVKQQVAAMRINLITRVTGSGKVAVNTDASLSFGNAGKLAVLNVKEGDFVTRGTVLAKQDTVAFEYALAQAKSGQAAAQTGIIQAQTAQTQAENGKIQAEAGLSATQFNLDRTQPITEIKDAITKIQNQMDVAQANLAIAQSTNDTNSISALNSYLSDMRKSLDIQNKKLRVLLNQSNFADVAAYYASISGQTYDRLILEDVRIKELAVESAQKSIESAQKAVEQAKQTIETARQGLETATSAVTLAQKNLNETTITAPFDGVIARLNYKQGDIIPAPAYTPQVVIYMVDFNNLEVDANIDEMDIPTVQAGQSAAISIDAFPETTLPGKVAMIIPVPNAQAAVAGATVYVTKVNFSVPAGMAVKIGMNANVTINTNERKNVLAVPSQAIKRDSQGKSFVEVLNGDKVELRYVTIGASSGANTEIVSGLNEGEKIVTNATVGKWSLQKTQE
jgi:HlyD family secretion protein